MKKATLLLALLFILSACQSRLTPAPVEVLPTPSRTPSPTVTLTPNATERYQGTLQANQTANAGYPLTQGVKQTEIAQTQSVKALTPTSTPTITPTDTPFPTWTPEPTSTPLPTVIPPQVSVSAYVLTDPKPGTLIYLLGQTMEQEYHAYEYSLDEQNIEAIDRVVNFEWERRYLGLNFDSSLLASLQDVDEYSWYSWYRPEFWFDYLAGATTDYLNQNAIELVNGVSTPYFNAETFLVEIDHDPDPEWLVWSEFEEFKSGVWVTLDQVGVGQYIRLANEIQVSGGVGSPYYSLYRLQDFTGDGLSDVIILWDAYFSGGTEVKQFQFLKGTPNGFKQVFEVLEDDTSPYDEISYEWVELEGEPPFLRVNHDRYLGWCRKVFIREFTWRGENVEENPVADWPDSPDCAIAAATWLAPDDQTTKQFLEMALDMDADNPQMSLENQVFVHYRLALIYTLEGNDLKTREHINYIITLAEKGEPLIAVNLANQIQPLLSEESVHPYLLCQASEKIFTSILMVGVSDDAYAYDGLPDGYPSPLCQISSIREKVMNQLEFDEFGPQKEKLEEEGLSVREIRPIFLADSIAAWIVFFQTRTLELDNQGSIWRDQEIAYFYLPETGWEYIVGYSLKDNTEWINEDFIGDNRIELAFGLRYEDSSCDINQTEYSIYLISSIGNDWFVPIEDFTCLSITEDFKLENFLQDQNQDGLADWIIDNTFNDFDLSLLENYPPPSPVVFDWWEEVRSLTYKPAILTALDEKFFTSPTPSLLRPDIEFYRSRWGTGDDPTSQQIYAHLTYLLALSYELEGDESQAVELFYDIWANHPDTLWAYLASSRLALKP